MPDEKLARAILSKVRRDILRILISKQKLSVHKLADILDISESSASKHLKLLYDLGILNCEDLGKEKYYSLKINEIKDFLNQYDKVVKKLGGK